MALTVEEKISKLEAHDNWLRFTEPQRGFLVALAEGLKPTDAYRKAYPDTKDANLVFATQQMLCRVGVKKILAEIEMDLRKPVVSRTEAQELVSYHLRKQNIEPEMLVKLLGVYAKLSGWDKQKEQEPDAEVDINRLVSAIEKKRKRNNTEESIES